MEKLKVLVYGDIDINMIDGSSIWIASIINVLSINKNIDINYLIKREIKNENILKSIKHIDTLKIINPFKNIKFNNSKMGIDEAADYIQYLDDKNDYDCIIIRGISLCEMVCKKESLRKKLICYVIPEKNNRDIESVSYEENIKLNYIYTNSRYIFAQTEESKELLMKVLKLNSDEKIIILPPMIPNIDNKKFSFINKDNRLIYSGKFCEKWYIYDILKCYQELVKEDNNIKLTVVGNKFHTDIQEKKEEILKILTQEKNITWIQGTSREESTYSMETSDIGISWRSSIIDNDNSVELSTKVLEYARAGIPIILNRSKIHERLLGEEYPLFVEDNKEDFKEKIKLALYNKDVYLKSAIMVSNAAKEYTFSQVYKRIHLRLWGFKKNKINLLFAGHDFKFIEKFINHCKKSGRFNIKIDKWKGHNNHDEFYSKECLEWADIIFCEWGLGNAAWYSKNKLEYQKLIVRIHSQERRTKYYKSFNINNIDNVICVGPYMFEEINKIMNIPREKINIIFNYVDCESLKSYKIENSKYNIGILGICPKSKRLDLAIDIFEKLWEKDKKYKLYIKGNHPSEYGWLMDRKEERLYYNNLFDRIDKSPWKENVVFDEFSEKINSWFENIGIILSTSDFESFHLSIAEGMASGCLPVILKWDGSEYIYPNKYICKTIDEAINLINENFEEIDSMNLIKYAQSNFDTCNIFRKIEQLLER